MKRITCFMLLGLLTLTGGSAFGQSVTLDHVDGQCGIDSIAAGETITFHFRISTDDTTYQGMSHGFHISTPDSAEWGSVTGVWDSSVFLPMFGKLEVVTSSTTGDGVDSVSVFGTIWSDGTTGTTPNLDEVAWTISIGPIDASHIGKTICLDSGFVNPIAYWLWIPEAQVDAVHPTWDGPHCFTIVGPQSCCEIRGDVDHSGGINIADLIYLDKYIDGLGPEPPCMDEGDVDGSGVVDADDSTYLLYYMFYGGPAPVPCQ